ncbi:MAG: right-handed parallel beta-helix repeat-containing protein [Allosphingosinicella sp.]
MTRTLALALAVAAPLATGPAFAQGSAPFTIVETGRGFASLQEAVNAIGEGDGTIRIAPGRYRDCAVQTAGRVAFKAAERGTAVFENAICEDKATLVLRGRASHVEGLVFTGTRVADGNGAGIRMEQGDLTVAWTQFRDGQCGILSANDPSGTISIDHSTFSRLGKHPNGNGAHSLYIGDFASLKVTNSRFERGTGGHYLKTRTPRVEIVGNSFDDSGGSATNYMIDLSAGATGRIAGNTFVQGTGKENYGTLIAVAPEGASNRSEGLVIENNDVSTVPGFKWGTTFVGNWSGEALTVRGNRVQKGIELQARH